MKRLAIGLALTICFVSVGWGQNGPIDTGQRLHSLWLEYQRTDDRSVGHALSVGFYTGYVLGVARVLSEPLEVVSLPKNMTNDQLFAVVGKYLDNHPEEWDKEADMIIFSALAQVWPNEAGIRRIKGQLTQDEGK